MCFDVRKLAFGVSIGLSLASAAYAQPSSNAPNSGDVAQHFNSGAHRVGRGAAEIGEGIKQGAIMTWQAVRNGADAVARRFDGDRREPHRDPELDHAGAVRPHY